MHQHLVALEPVYFTCKHVYFGIRGVHRSVSLSLRMEGGELFHRVKAQQQLDESNAKLYFYQMLRAVQVRRTPDHRFLLYANVSVDIFTGAMPT